MHANIDAQGGEFGNTLHAASYSDYEQVVDMLLSSRANINFEAEPMKPRDREL